MCGTAILQNLQKRKEVPQSAFFVNFPLSSSLKPYPKLFLSLMGPSPTDVDEIDHYKVLDLPSGEEGSRLTADHIEKAYKTQSRLRHPDKRPDDPNATADFQLLRASYDVLRDEQSRRAFDAKLRALREKEVRDLARDGKRRKLAADLEKRERAAERGEPLDAAEMERRRERSVANELKRELDAFLTRNVRRSEPATASASVRARVSLHDSFSLWNLLIGQVMMTLIVWKKICKVWILCK